MFSQLRYYALIKVTARNQHLALELFIVSLVSQMTVLSKYTEQDITDVSANNICFYYTKKVL